MNFDRAKDVFILMLLDVSVLACTLTLSVILRRQEVLTLDFLLVHMLASVFIILVTVVSLFVLSMYDLRAFILKKRVFVYAPVAVAVAIVFASTFFYLLPYFGVSPRLTLLIYGIVSCVTLILNRILMAHLFLSGPKVRALLITRPGVGRELRETLLGHNPFPYEIIESFEIASGTQTDKVRESLHMVLKKEKIQAVIVDHTHPELSELAPLYVALFGRGIEILRFEDVYESVFGRIHPISHNPQVFLGYAALHSGIYTLCKRVLDIAISLPMLILSAPFILIGYIGIKLQDGGSFLFVHERIGKYGKIIRIYKMRTMQRADNGVWVKDSNNTNKVTSFGYFLRKTRIDELPQLWNVLRGDISLIGPRPDIVNLGRKLAGEIDWYDMRLIVPPGLSGWAQTQMHTPPQSVEESKERLMYDLYYIKHRSLFLDILIGLRTIKTLLSREGV